MGQYWAFTAVRADDPAAVRDAVLDYLAAYDVDAQATAVTDELTNDMLAVYPSSDRWTVAFWPNFFIGAWPAGRRMSATLGTHVSAVNIIAGSYWTHAAFDAGTEIDRYSPLPENDVPGPAARRSDCQHGGRRLGHLVTDLEFLPGRAGELQRECQRQPVHGLAAVLSRSASGDDGPQARLRLGAAAVVNARSDDRAELELELLTN